MKKINRYKFKNFTVGTISNLFKVLFCVFFAFPFYWMLITSCKTYMESIKFPPTLIPEEFTFEAYTKVFQSLEWGTYLKNSIVIIVGIMLLSMVIMVPAAYAFARYNFKGQGALFAMVMAAFLVPGQLTFITIYIMFSDLNLLDTLLPQILPFGANAFGIFMLRQNFKQIPEELIESARLDDASEVQIMTKIMLPMAKSTMATIIMTSFISHWNAYFWPLVMTNSESLRPLTMAIAKLKDIEGAVNWPIVMAGNVILVLPTLIIFLLGSKKLIESMAYRGVK